MAAKKLAPKASKLTNPSVGVRRNKSSSQGYGTDARSPADRDGNEQQARQQRSGADRARARRA
jgi:hypothetical protein